uniref:60S ribosomal protein L41 n=1 Tax=Anopheles atroparvus TaxID=41427 RepID=A0A182IUU8_ANOAO
LPKRRVANFIERGTENFLFHSTCIDQCGRRLVFTAAKMRAKWRKKRMRRLKRKRRKMRARSNRYLPISCAADLNILDERHSWAYHSRHTGHESELLQQVVGELSVCLLT